MPTAFIGAGSAIMVLAAFFGAAGLLAKHSVRDEEQAEDIARADTEDRAVTIYRDQADDQAE